MPARDAMIILVLGMHRSGTSMLTAGLPALGIDLGPNLMPPRPGDNDKGYFENPDIVALNEQLLAMDGYHWSSLAYGRRIDYGAERYAAQRAEAGEILATQFGPGPIAIKDPRLCLTLPFWHQVIEAARPGAEILHLHLFRHPTAIAASFAARALRPGAAALVEPIGDDAEQALLLWLSYSYQALRNSRGRNNCCLQQAALLDDPVAALTALAMAHDLDLDSARLAGFARDFIDPRLTHHRGDTLVAARHPRLGFIDALWSSFSGLSGPLGAGAHAALLAGFPDLEFAYLWSVQARHWLDERERAQRLEAELAAKQQVIDGRDAILRTLYAERDAARTEAARQAAERKALQTAVDVREAKLRALYAERDQLSAERDRHEVTAESAERRFQELQRKIERLRPDLQLKRFYRRLRGG